MQTPQYKNTKIQSKQLPRSNSNQLVNLKFFWYIIVIVIVASNFLEAIANQLVNLKFSGIEPKTSDAVNNPSQFINFDKLIVSQFSLDRDTNPQWQKQLPRSNSKPVGQSKVVAGIEPKTWIRSFSDAVNNPPHLIYFDKNHFDDSSKDVEPFHHKSFHFVGGVRRALGRFTMWRELTLSFLL